jgi:hypothetical protein
MERCKECELAIYCFSDSSSWIFRTTQEMEEKKDAICNCPVHAQVQKARTGEAETVMRQKGEGQKRS